MLVEQAIFTSARTRRHHGYQVVARSPGVDERLEQFLACWGPTHGSLTSRDVDAESLNYSPIDRDWVALSRTLYGGPEYSGRGALQVVTRFLLLRRSQLEGYQNHPVVLARTARILGHLWLGKSTGPKIPEVQIPERAPQAALENSASGKLDPLLMQRALKVLRAERLALVGELDPLTTMARLIEETPPERRLELSFSTGLWPSQHRRFRVHLLPQLDTDLHARLTQQGIRFVATAV